MRSRRRALGCGAALGKPRPGRTRGARRREDGPARRRSGASGRNACPGRARRRVRVRAAVRRPAPAARTDPRPAAGHPGAASWRARPRARPVGRRRERAVSGVRRLPVIAGGGRGGRSAVVPDRRHALAGWRVGRRALVRGAATGRGRYRDPGGDEDRRARRARRDRAAVAYARWARSRGGGIPARRRGAACGGRSARAAGRADGRQPAGIARAASRTDGGPAGRHRAAARGTARVRERGVGVPDSCARPAGGGATATARSGDR